MNSPTDQTIFDRVQSSHHIQISIDNLARGIDNYHIDVQLSKRFRLDAKKLIEVLINQLSVPNPKRWNNSNAFEKLRETYVDMLTVLIHRVKTDLIPDDVAFLQFAIIKHLLITIRKCLDDNVATVATRLTEYRNKGASEALAGSHRLFWLKKNYDLIMYNVSKQIFGQLLRAEERELQTVRSQFLGEEFQFTRHAFFNPLLYTSQLSSLPLLLNEYSLFSWNEEDEGFIQLNKKLEKLMNRRMADLEISPLRDSENSDVDPEIHDELGGLFETQPFLGTAADAKNHLQEHFNWFEIEENIELLFDINRLSDELKARRKELGFKEWWRQRAELNRIKTTVLSFSRMLRSNKALGQLLASQYMRRSLSASILEIVDLKVVCQFLCGKIKIKKLQESIKGSTKLNKEQIKSLEELRSKIKKQISKADHDDTLRLLCDFSAYRRDLKYYRFAHRAINRISILRSEEDLKLSRTAGTLYQIPTTAEVEEDDERICHHAIMKADVRGSTTVTDELQAKGLNPASYFSMRFFNPINKILETYGASKVFIEGDAIILSFLEYEHTPQQWFAVARACGYSRDMIKIVSSNNRYSSQMGLPNLELGVGICYSDAAPRFLYDEDKPIMISGAIGLADRMSSCSWNLRKALNKTLFNVDVLRIADGESDKGQQYIRYNVNGILLDNDAFEKLNKEVSLRTLKIKINGKDYLFHVGQYPDMQGRKKDLVIREGKVGVWKELQIQEGVDSDEVFYEVVVNRKITSMIRERINNLNAA